MENYTGDMEKLQYFALNARSDLGNVERFENNEWKLIKLNQYNALSSLVYLIVCGFVKLSDYRLVENVSK